VRFVDSVCVLLFSGQTANRNNFESDSRLGTTGVRSALARLFGHYGMNASGLQPNESK